MTNLAARNNKSRSSSCLFQAGFMSFPSTPQPASSAPFSKFPHIIPHMLNSCSEVLIDAPFKPMLTCRTCCLRACNINPAILFRIVAQSALGLARLVFMQEFQGVRVKKCLLCLLRGRARVLIDSSSTVSIVLIRRMFTLRIRGSTKMKSTPMNPIIIFTSGQGKPHRGHTCCLLHCEFMWVSVVNVRGVPASVPPRSCPAEKRSGEMRTKSAWWSVDI